MNRRLRESVRRLRRWRFAAWHSGGRAVSAVLSVLVGFVATALPAGGQDPFAADMIDRDVIEGVVEPVRRVRLAAAEMGLIDELLVDVGDEVAVGEVLARLDTKAENAALAVAREAASGTGESEAARAALGLAEETLRRLRHLDAAAVRRSELERAVMQWRLAAARVRAAEEQTAVRQRELRRAQIAVKRRDVISPIAGVITEVHHRAGEYLSPSEPVVVTVMDIESVVARFAVAPTIADRLKPGQTLNVHVVGVGIIPSAPVRRIAPTVDAASGTVEVEVLLENPERRIRPGHRCTLSLGRSGFAAATATGSPRLCRGRARILKVTAPPVIDRISVAANRSGGRQRSVRGSETDGVRKR